MSTEILPKMQVSSSISFKITINYRDHNIQRKDFHRKIFMKNKNILRDEVHRLTWGYGYASSLKQLARG